MTHPLHHLTLTPSLTLTLTLAIPPTPTPSHYPSYSHSHTITLLLSLPHHHTIPLTLTPTPSHSYSHSHTITLSLLLSLPHHHTFPLTPTPSHYPSYSHSHTITLSLLLSLPHHHTPSSHFHPHCLSLIPSPTPPHPSPPTDTPEAAYVQAVTSAGMMSVISRKCKRNLLQKCSCDSTPKTPPPDQAFFWGGCGDNHDYGYTFSKQFSTGAVDSSGPQLSTSELMQQHNTEAGRKVGCIQTLDLLNSTYCLFHTSTELCHGIRYLHHLHVQSFTTCNY